MADIFISYASEDRGKARILAQALELDNSVWWDRLIPTGKIFEDVIKDEIDAARVVIVLWSNSRWAASGCAGRHAQGAGAEQALPCPD